MEKRVGLAISNPSGERGVAIVAVMMVLVVVGLLGGSAIVLTTQEIQLCERVRMEKQALYLAESGKERAYSVIMNDTLGNFASLENPGIVSDARLGGGSYDLAVTTLSESPKVVEIVSTGRTNGVEKQVTVVAEVFRENVCVWNNAIFGGAGYYGGVIEGYSKIHGSVHLLGDDVVSGNTAIGMIDANGNALISNTYDGMDNRLLAKVPALPTTVFAGETVETLNARVRVKNGAVGISGVSQIGSAQEVGNHSKESVTGVYIENDVSELRWTGDQVTDGVPDPSCVHSDNGTAALYDLDETTVVRPLLGDPYTDPETGISYDSFEACFSSKALILPSLILDDTISAARAINDHEFGDGVSVLFEDDAFFVTDGTNKIIYDPTALGGTSRLHVRGRIQIDGELVIGNGSLDILYSGRGTIYAAGNEYTYGDIDVHSNLLPVGTFATDDVLGLMAKRNMNVGTGDGDANLVMAAACYAGDTITSAKQSQVAGTFVCRLVDMGGNAPSIFQVPKLVDNLPPGLIGSEPIWATLGFDEKSWTAG